MGAAPRGTPANGDGDVWVGALGFASQAPPHDDNVLREALHLGHLKAAQFAVEVQHPLVGLPHFTEGAVGALGWEDKVTDFKNLHLNLLSDTFIQRNLL